MKIVKSREYLINRSLTVYYDASSNSIREVSIVNRSVDLIIFPIFAMIRHEVISLERVL